MENLYDFALDMSTENSNSVILKNINPNSTVLECGCAHGRMTKYLKENLNCNVSITEINEEAGKNARQWADHYFLGEQGDLESGLLSLLAANGAKFDYVIFADVLEHLHQPELVLAEAKNLLNKDGSIWISIPNICHNSVLIDLWNNKFEYRETGLLDNTHIRFFSYYSLKEMVERCGLTVITECNLKNVVENTEFKNSYADVRPEIVWALKKRDHAETYQFVWELKVSGL